MEQRRSFILNQEDYAAEFQTASTALTTAAPQISNHPTELRIIANVHTYFNISSKRLIESIPMICEIAFAQGLGEKLRKEFVGELGLIGEDGLGICQKFGQEEPGLREKRAALGRLKKIVDDALAVLDEARTA
jgi:hypothetical protein